MLCLQLKAYPEIYEGYVPMAYSDYLKKMNKYYPYLNFYGFTLKALLKEFHAYTFFSWVDETEVVNGVIMSHCRLRQIRYGQQPNISSFLATHLLFVCLVSTVSFLDFRKLVGVLSGGHTLSSHIMA